MDFLAMEIVSIEEHITHKWDSLEDGMSARTFLRGFVLRP